MEQFAENFILLGSYLLGFLGVLCTGAYLADHLDEKTFYKIQRYVMGKR